LPGSITCSSCRRAVRRADAFYRDLLGFDIEESQPSRRAGPLVPIG
jgi:hypothetical protein